MNASRDPLDESHLLDHLDFIRKRWRMILAIFLGFVAAAAFATRRLPPVYQSTTRVLVGAGLSSNLLSDRANPIESYFLERRSFETQLEVIRSEPVAALAAERLGRIDESTSEEQRRGVIAAIKSAVSVNRVRDTRILVLRADGPSPGTARAIAEAVARAYIDYSREQQDAARRRSIAWLTSETANLREALRRSEERLVDYLSSEQIDPALEEDEGGLAPGGGDALRARIDAATLELSQLRQRYRDRHPKVIDARSRLAALRERAAASQARVATDNRKLIQYRILKRDADLDHQMYQVLLKKLKEADLSAGIGEPDIRVLEAATRPRSAVAPSVPRNLGVAAVLGLCLALGLAYGLEMFDRTLGTPEVIERVLGLPTLAVVRRFAAREARQLVAESARGVESETFRALRTNVRFSHIDQPRRCVLVTSTGPEEGKSTVLSNLGVSLASSERSTLVIDTDLRRPSLHALFGIADIRGIADVLAGDVAVDDAIQQSHVQGLDVLTSGTRPPNPAELIESRRLHDLIAALRERYDYILLDSPPAGGLIDASLLSALADGVLFVVEPGRFDRRIVRAALRQLERAGARLYGVVLNKAPRGEDAGLYGYYQYGRELAEASGRTSPVGAG